jgi:hypothetical protein
VRYATVFLGFLACGGPPSPAPAPPFEWRFDLAELDDALLAAWIDGPDRAIAVGGGVGGGLVLEWDGLRWRSEPLPPDTPTLWWVWAHEDAAFAVGEGSHVLRRAREGEAWRREPVDAADVEQTLYGIWGTGPDDLWAVGGTLSPRERPGIILHFDGSSWTAAQADAALFKVWGASATDVWAVGDGGAILHWDGEAWTTTPSGTTERLIAVFGRGSRDVYAVGGAGQGLVLRWDGVAWTPFETTPEALSGVWTAPGRPLYVAGARGFLARLGQAPAQLIAAPDVDFHALAGHPMESGDRVVTVGADLLSGANGVWRGALASHGVSLAGPLEGLPGPDAGRNDAPPDSAALDGGGPGEGQPCAPPDGGGVPMCRADLDCWLLADDGALICTQSCNGAAECDAYGESPCCARPGPQTFETVCIPRGNAACP